MIHYKNGKPHKNIRLQKAKRHAVEHYRHTERMATVKDYGVRISVSIALALTLAAIYLLAN